MNASLTELEGKLTMLMLELRGTPTFERVKLYVLKMTGAKLLSEYLHDGAVLVKERAMLATTLIDILLTRDYSRLPELPAPSPVIAVKEVETLGGRGAESPAEEADEDDETEITMPRAEIERMIRAEVRRELGNVMELIAKVLKETK